MVTTEEFSKFIKKGTQIPKQWFETEGLLLINNSLSEDGAQEYSVYKKDENTQTFYAVETITVSWMSSEDIEECLIQLTETPLEELDIIPLLGMDKEISFERMEIFKEEFEKFAAKY